MKKIIQQLSKLGLSEKEAEAYIALVHIEKGTAYSIAKYAGMKRSNVYLLLDQLRKKGLVIKVPHTKNQIFIAKDPDEFFKDYEENFLSVKKTVRAMTDKNKKNGIEVLLFEGRGQLENAFRYKRKMWENKKISAFYGMPKKGSKVSEEYYEYYQSLIDQGSVVRAITPRDSSLSTFKKLEKENLQEVVNISLKEYSPKVSVEFDKEISKIFLHTDPSVLVIESKEFSEFLQQLFEIAWKAKQHS